MAQNSLDQDSLEKSDDLKSVQLAARLNGSTCRALEDLPAPAKPERRQGLPRMNVCEVAPRLAQFEAPLDAVVRGYNAVELTVKQGGPQGVIWLEILMDPSPDGGDTGREPLPKPESEATREPNAIRIS